MFRTNIPVTDEAFRDRDEELRQLEEAVSALKQGAPRWLALIGPRKIGKTSLLLQLERRQGDGDVVFAVLDSFEDRPLSLEIFRRHAQRRRCAALAR